MNNSPGFVARSRNARARAEAKHAKWIEDAPIRAQLNTLRDLDRARNDVLSAQEAVVEAEKAVETWAKSLRDYRAYMGLRAEPREIRDMTARIDIAGEALAGRKHALAAAESRLAALMPAPASPAKKKATN